MAKVSTFSTIEEKLNVSQELLAAEQKAKETAETENITLRASLEASKALVNGLQEKVDTKKTKALEKEKATEDLKQKLKDLQTELEKLTSPQHLLSIIRDWVHNHASYISAAQHTYNRGFFRGCGFIRKQILQVFPEADLNKFRAFADERIKTDWSTLFTEGVKFPPAVNFDNTLTEEKENMVPELPYDTTE